MADQETTQTSQEEEPMTVRIPSSTPGDDIPETGGAKDGKATKAEGEDDDAGDPDAEDKGSDKDTDPDEGKDIDYKDKFANSTRENQRILEENNTLQSARKGDGATIERLNKEMEDLRKIAEGSNPEGLEKFDLKKSADDNARQLAELKLENEIDRFVSKTPGADERREALKNLAKVFPTKSLADIWGENFKGVGDAVAKAKEDKTTSQKKTQPEKGKGTSTKEPGGETIAGMPVAEFNKLSVSERRSALIKAGIS